MHHTNSPLFSTYVRQRMNFSQFNPTKRRNLFLLFTRVVRIDLDMKVLGSFSLGGDKDDPL